AFILDHVARGDLSAPDDPFKIDVDLHFDFFDGLFLNPAADHDARDVHANVDRAKGGHGAGEDFFPCVEFAHVQRVELHPVLWPDGFLSVARHCIHVHVGRVDARALFHEAIGDVLRNPAGTPGDEIGVAAPAHDSAPSGVPNFTGPNVNVGVMPGNIQ